MKTFAVYNINGDILRTGTCVPSDLPLQAHNDEYVMEVDASVGDASHRINAQGEVVNKPPPSDMERNIEAVSTLRKYRTMILSGCDWTQLADAPFLPNRVLEWRVYRTALRDLPAQYPDILDIDEVVFPVQPE